MTSNHLITLFLLRHGQSEWNAQGRWQGQADSPLTQLGKKQALKASESIGAVDLIVSSPQERAFNTAGIISEQIGVGPVHGFEGLKERSAGEWSGLTHDEIGQKWPGWIENGSRPPGFESDESLSERIWETVGQVVASSPGPDILVVCHGGVIRQIEQDLGADNGRVPNLSGTTMTYDGTTFEAGARVELVSSSEATADHQRQTL